MRQGVRWKVVDKVLNHVSGAIRGVAAVYQWHEFLAERETAMCVLGVLSVSYHVAAGADIARYVAL